MSEQPNEPRVSPEDVRLPIAGGKREQPPLLVSGGDVKPALDILEDKLIRYATTQKVAEVVDSYLKTRVLPAVAIAIAVAAYFGVELRQQASEVATGKAELQRLADDLQRQRAIQEAATRDFNATTRVVNDQLTDLKNSLSRTGDRVADVRQLTDVLSEQSRKTEASLAGSSLRLAALDQLQSTLKDQSGQTQKSLEVSADRIGKLIADLDAAQNEYSRLKQLDSLQQRLLSANVVEFVTLFSYKSSPPIKLPKKGGGEYVVRFETPHVQERFALKYTIDGQEHTTNVSQESRGQWYTIADTGGAYEFTVDHLFTTPKAPNFVTIRIKGTASLFNESS